MAMSFHKPASFYLLSGPVLSQEVRHLVHWALWSLHNYPILLPAKSTPLNMVTDPLHGVLYFLPVHEAFNAMQAEIWAKIPHHILEIICLPLQGQMSAATRAFWATKSGGYGLEGLWFKIISKNTILVLKFFLQYFLLSTWFPYDLFQKGTEQSANSEVNIE